MRDEHQKPQDLLEDHQKIPKGSGPWSRFFAFWGYKTPDIGTHFTYKWSVSLRANRISPHIEKFVIKCVFPDASGVDIGEHAPGNEHKDKVSITVAFGALGGSVSLTKPIVKKSIDVRKLTDGVTWEFLDIDLGSNLEEVIEGAFSVSFSQAKELPLKVEILPIFCGRRLGRTGYSKIPTDQECVIKIGPQDPSVKETERGIQHLATAETGLEAVTVQSVPDELKELSPAQLRAVLRYIGAGAEISRGLSTPRK